MTVLSEDMRRRIAEAIARFPRKQAATLPALHIVQDELRHVPVGAIREIAALLDVHPAEVHDTLSFYGFFRDESQPLGKRRVWVCRSLSCMLRGGEDLLTSACQSLHVQPGETTGDGEVTLEYAECLGACDGAPCLLVDDECRMNVSDWDQAHCTENRTNGDGSPAAGALPWPAVSAGNHEPVLLRRVGRPDSTSLAAYRADGGYRGLTTALAMAPGDVTKLVTSSGLRGRGGAGFNCGMKWSFVPKDHSGPVYLCVNADESEPGTFKDRILMEHDPHQVLEGIAIAAYAIRARTAYLYLRYEFGRSYRVLEQAIRECYEANLLGRNILGSGFDLDVHLHRGAGAYICGEETGLIESLEGKRAWPRIKPPFPAIQGLFRQPTIVNNVETLSCVTQILARGVDWFKSIGVPPDPGNPRDPGSYGPKLYCVSGHVNRPGCYELPLGVTARELLEEHAGGVWQGRGVKAVVPGGISMGFLSADELDTPLDFSGPGRAGCLGLGTAAVIVVDDETSMVDVLHNCCRFFAHESCGQCTPCREGTSWAVKILDRIRAGHGQLRDLDLLLEIAGSMGTIPGTTICGLADGAAWPVKNALTKFRAEFEDYITAGRRSEARALAGVH